MIALKIEVLNILNLLACKPANNQELAIIIVLSLLAAVLVLKAAAKALDFSMADIDLAAVCVLVPYVLSIVAIAALKVYVLGKIADPRLQLAVIIVTLLVILLAVAMTLCKMLMKGGYFMSLAPIIFSVVAAVVITIGAKYTIGAVKEIIKGFDATKDRTEAVNKDLQK